MKRLLTLLLLLCLGFAAPPTLTAQEEEDNPLEMNLDALQSDLEKISQDLTTYDDIEVCDYAFQEAGNRLKSFAALISKDSPLYDHYNNCNLLYYQLQKRIQDLQDEHQHKQDYDALMNRLQNAITELSTLKEQGEHYVQSKQQDSLLIVKKKASKIYMKASGESESQKQLLDSDPALQQLYNSIEEANEAIESLECRNRGQLYEMGFRIIMVASMLLLLANMLKAKIKAKKVAKETQKQMNKLMMGGDDTPTL